MSVLVMDLQHLTANLIMVYNLCKSFVQLGKKEEVHSLNSSSSYGRSSFSKDRLKRIQVGWKANAACFSVLFLTLMNLVLRRGQVCRYVYSCTCTK